MAQKNKIKSSSNNIDEIKNDLKPEKKKKSDDKNIFQNIISFFLNEKVHQVFGAFLIAFSLFSLVAFISYLYYWEYDDNLIDNSISEILFNKDLVVKNWMSKIGAIVSYIFIKKWFGIASFAFLLVFFNFGVYLLFNIKLLPLIRTSRYIIIGVLWTSIVTGFILVNTHYEIIGGAFGGQMSYWLVSLLGKIGVSIFLVLSLIIILIVEYNVSFRRRAKQKNINDINYNSEAEDTEEDIQVDYPLGRLFRGSKFDLQKDSLAENDEDIDESEIKFELKQVDKNNFEINDTINNTENSLNNSQIKTNTDENSTTIISDGLEIIMTNEDVIADINEIEKLNHYTIDTPFDPRLELSNYRFPTLDLLEDYGHNYNTTVKEGELHANKDRILETLKNYSISIDKISATIGPTVTLYEIVPAPGVRISKIKNLEDDIALSLSALGIRIIAPIPGKGTIGIEVPNSNPEIVPMKSVLSSEKFVNAKYDLPIGLGKTISNESFIYDLAKMPHLLMAGATGQGKSVGLNAVITSLLYKKHPSELKFIMVDPKKVELTLFSKIERHYLAKLPDSDEAIITDTKKVVRTLNSLCIEMDARYDLLKDAHCRNIKEYNLKFTSRKLNPNEGHKYLPYIVLIVDEFADLIMTAGKEVETPIARLAQLARAIGIHLIIATQRPSVNIITGTIKANFPSRLAFRVTSKIDSRTILDASGAEQLIGRGDMLLSNGNELIRLQCAFVDTPEVERITEFIGNQRGYPDAFYLPEVPDDDGEESLKDFDPNDRDPLFMEAARMMVQSQHGSTSLLQRKLKLGYNRAGRIIDQLESAGVVGPFEGSKAREVRIKDEFSLEQFFRDNNM